MRRSLLALVLVACDPGTSPVDDPAETDATDDTEVPDARATTWTFEGGWACTDGVICQDVYTLDVEAGTRIDVVVDGLDGASTARAALFAPDDRRDGRNLYTNVAADLQCTDPGQDATLPRMVAPVAGTYQLAIGRLADAAGAGTYRVTVTTSEPSLAAPFADDEPSLLLQVRCGWQDLVSAGWNGCGAGAKCRDTYTLRLAEGTDVQVQLDDVQGDSWARLTVNGPDQGADGTNVLTGAAADLCATGQDAPFDERLVPDRTGTWTIAVTRDWAASGGSVGTYRLRVGVRGTVPPEPLLAVADDEPTSRAPTTCEDP